jgi:hypothetical protein
VGTVTSGVKTEITTHMRYDSRCQANSVAIKIAAAPANGTVTTEAKPIVVPPQSDRGMPQQAPCIGKTVEGAAVYYQSKHGFVRQDIFRYQRLNPRDAGDKFNKEVSYTIAVKLMASHIRAQGPPIRCPRRLETWKVSWPSDNRLPNRVRHVILVVNQLDAGRV